MSRHRSRVLLSTLGLLVGATCALAVTDDLQCFKVTNETLKKLRAVVDLDTPSIGVASGCKLSKAKLYCTPTETKLRPGTVVDGHTPVETIPFGGPPAESARICYGLKCKKPSGTAGDQVALDQLGEHRFNTLTTSMVCRSVADVGVFCTDGQRAGSCEPAFRIVTLNVDIQPGQEITYCYYFHTPNTGPVAIKQFTSHMPASLRRLSVVLTKTDLKPPGTLSASDCSPGSTGGIYYAGSGTDDEFTFPADDGTGTPVGAILPPGQSGYVWMHNVNETTDVVNVHAEVGMFVYPSGTTVTRADPYVTFNGQLEILPNANKLFSASCDVPPGGQVLLPLDPIQQAVGGEGDRRWDGDQSPRVRQRRFREPGTGALLSAGLLLVHQRQAPVPVLLLEPRRQRRPNDPRWQQRRDRRGLHGARFLLPVDRAGVLLQQRRQPLTLRFPSIRRCARRTP